MTKDRYYFPHDYNARNDPRMVALRTIHKCTGIAVYWTIIEMLHEQADHCLSLNKYMLISIASESGTEPEEVTSVIDFCTDIEVGLLKRDGDVIVSERVNRNISERSEVSAKRSRAGKKSAENRALLKVDEEKPTSVEQVLTSVEQTATKGNKGKERKRKEKKEEKNIIGDAANSLYPEFLSIYDDFIKRLTNVPAKINGKEGKAAKEIINYMTRACRNKNATATDEDVLNAFRYVLDNYAKWEKFHQGQLELSQISKNLVNIINAIKNGRVDKTGKAPATDPADIRRIVEAGILSVTVP